MERRTIGIYCLTPHIWEDKKARSRGMLNFYKLSLVPLFVCQLPALQGRPSPEDRRSLEKEKNTLRNKASKYEKELKLL